MDCIVSDGLDLNIVARQRLNLEFIPVTAIEQTQEGFELELSGGGKIDVRKTNLSSVVRKSAAAAEFSRILGVSVRTTRGAWEGVFMDMLSNEFILVGEIDRDGAGTEWWVIRRAEDSAKV